MLIRTACPDLNTLIIMHAADLHLLPGLISGRITEHAVVRNDAARVQRWSQSAAHAGHVVLLEDYTQAPIYGQVMGCAIRGQHQGHSKCSPAIV